MIRRYAPLGLALLMTSACGARSSLDDEGTGASSVPGIYVADSHGASGDSGRIVRFNDMKGTGWTTGALGAVGTVVTPCGPALGSDGTVYFAALAPGRIYAMKDVASGQVAALEDGAGSEAPLPGVLGVAVDGADRLYVLDTSLSRLIRVDDLTGAGWVTFGSAGSGTGQLSAPLGLAVSSSGRILIGDTDNHRVVQIDDMSGAGWAEWPMPGSNGASLGWPFGVAYDSQDRIYAVDFGLDSSAVHRIDSIAGDGHVVFTSGSLLQASHVAVGPEGRIFLTLMNVGNSVVAMDDMTGTNLVSFGSSGTGTGQFENPCGIAVK